MAPATDPVRLLADVGGTNARFALQTAAGIGCIEVLPCAGYPALSEALSAYLALARSRGHAVGALRHAGIAIANPVDGDIVRMTNHHWTFSIGQMRAEHDLATLLVVNDFAALARALPLLNATQRERIGGGVELAGRTMGLVGAGTGLGVSSIAPAGDGRWIALAGEGGHVSFAPSDRAEMRLLDALWNEFGHVSAERLLSGAGLELMHRVLAGEALQAAQVTAGALGGDAACRRTVEAFCAILGGVAGNIALTVGATGGMYIGGGIVPRFGPLFRQSAFRARFESKGRMSAYLAPIPTWLVTDPYAAFTGMAALLAEEVDAREPVNI